MDDQAQDIEDSVELAAIREQARLINIKTLATATALTALALLLPT